MDIQRVLAFTQEVEKQLQGMDKLKFPIYINDTADIISTITKTKIKYTPAGWGDPNSQQIRSALFLYDAEKDDDVSYVANISYNSSLNPCWTRFAICKELCHILIDSEKSATKDIIKLASILVEEMPLGVIDMSDEEQEAWHSESLAELAALEILFPFSERSKIRANLDRGYWNMPIYQIALTYKIPQYYVARGISSPYLDIMYSEYQKLEASPKTYRDWREVSEE